MILKRNEMTELTAPLTLERQTSEYRESQFIKAKTSLGSSALYRKTWTVTDEFWMLSVDNLTVKNSRRSQLLRGLHAVVTFTSQTSTRFSQWILEKNLILQCGEGKGNHFGTCQSILSLIKSALRRNRLPLNWLIWGKGNSQLLLTLSGAWASQLSSTCEVHSQRGTDSVEDWVIR